VILIAYDGSDDAKAALETAGKLFPGQQVTILNVWQRFIDTMARTGAGFGVIVDYDEIDSEAENAAREKAEEGVALAKESGLDASAETAVVDTTVADAILNAATQAAASAIVCGSRGHSGVKSLILGSVSNHILQHADLPVVVVPSPAVAQARAEHLQSLR
jgi:nucleotide-binding universal stress UspA family protein